MKAAVTRAPSKSIKRAATVASEKKRRAQAPRPRTSTIDNSLNFEPRAPGRSYSSEHALWISCAEDHAAARHARCDRLDLVLLLADYRLRLANFVAPLLSMGSFTPRTAPASALVSFDAASPIRTAAAWAPVASSPRTICSALLAADPHETSTLVVFARLARRARPWSPRRCCRRSVCHRRTPRG